MSYRIILSPRAVRRINEFVPDALLQEFDQELRALAASPVTLSRPSRVPAELPGYQVYEFELPDGLTFKVFFKYGTDEETLYVVSVGRIADR